MAKTAARIRAGYASSSGCLRKVTKFTFQGASSRILKPSIMATALHKCMGQWRTVQTVYRSCCQVQQCRRLSRLGVSSAKLREQLLQYDGGSVDLQKDDTSGLATVTMNNPDKHNALTGKMIVDFDDCVRELEDWPSGKGVILTGQGNTFCSGGDLNFVKHIMNGQKGYEMSTLMHEITTRLLNLPLVSVAAISGHALGGGAELVTACDFRVMSNNAKIAFVQVKLHVAPGWGGATRLVRLLGRSKALQLLTSGKVITAELGRDLGFVDEIVPEGEDTLEHTRQWLSRTCVGDAAVAGVIKSMVVAGSTMDMFESLAMERQLFARVWGNPAQAKIVMEKTKSV